MKGKDDKNCLNETAREDIVDSSYEIVNGAMRGGTAKPPRESGIELLRILAACGVILLHYNDGKAFKWVESNTINQYLLFGIESLCICAVDLFMVISGYFLGTTQKRKAIKPVELILQIGFNFF